MKFNLRTSLAVAKWTVGKGYLRPVADLSEVAEEIGSTPETLSEYFLRYRKKPFMKWRKEKRMEYARKLLVKNPGMSLSELGEASGVPDRSDFRRQFIEVFGLSPSELSCARARRKD